MDTIATPTRRGMLALAAGGVAITLLPRPASAQLAAPTQAAIDRIRGGRTPQEGRVTLRVPPIAENGNTVPLTVSVESPMTTADHVKAIHVFADRNPTPDIATFHMTPAMGRASADTRIRLGQTQDVVALAEMSDGSLFIARAEVKVTIGGCGG
ncbi:thiosulfate oxidation carrier protein SoxY [Roseomonas eburnea]|uniref:Thiosulfate oxidation carrier protein SoxY n=1 Tax=Neoroseomonas eburnea TaxID=1346889 RepID=A0A9X9XG20_9PROT|nr:thiosulfate oxidation carrier protein SoxY [Neoroseomonas eburnea]MBR0682656.1 thiosulfate oxidation carrier protein SoxY [Neoroseomonas eburnea]